MAKSLIKLKRKKEWKWDNEHQKAFKELKNKNVYLLSQREKENSE